MSTLFTNMGLIGWDLGSDPYSHAQLANNFAAIDAHDHSSGKGVQIATAGIRDGAITTVKLATGAVTTIKIADGAVTLPKLDPAIFASLLPLGLVFPLLVTAGMTIPAGAGYVFEIAEGQTLHPRSAGTGPYHDFPTGGNVVLPNLQNQFIAFDTSGANTGSMGGGNTKNLAHKHRISAHHHGIPSHTHTTAHDHALEGHDHVIGSDGSHAHKWDANFGTNPTPDLEDLSSRPVQIHDGDTATRRQALFVPNFNNSESSATIPMNASGSHSHSGHTSGLQGTPRTLAASPAVSGAFSGVTDDSDGVTETTDPSSGATMSSVDIRPAYTIFLPLIRVRTTP